MEYRFDPEFADFIPLLPEMDMGDPVARRAAFAELIAPLNAGVDVSGLEITDRTVPGQGEGPAVRVRIYRPASGNGTRPGLVYLHGGGFVVGSLDTEHAAAAAIARNVGAVVVSVDYRLAPEHPYPAGVDDCYAALVWTADNAPELGIDPGRLGVMGQSAGGGLTAAVALLARDRGGPPICFQYLGIPELDDRLDSNSMRAFVDTPMWNRPAAVKSWEYYLGELHGSRDVPAYAAPARATDLSNLPPAYVSTMEFDPLRDEGIAYALRLLEAGVPVELHHYPGTFHGSSIIPSASVSQRQAVEMFQVLERGLGCKGSRRA